MNGPTFLSTFSGVGGLDLGLHRAGWRCVGQAEQDEYRRAVLTERFPGVPCADDVRNLHALPHPGGRRDGERGLRAAGARGRPARADGQQGAARGVDLLCGGFPCQDLSVAGRRRGLAGERSGLFFEFARIADAVRPRFLLIENVPGLLSSNGGRDFGELLGTLADLGYGVGWRILDSRFFGVPQRRRRVFIVGCDLGGRAGAERAGPILAVGSGCGGHPAAGEQEVPGPAAGLGFGSAFAGALNGKGTDSDATDGIVVSTLGTSRGGGHGLNAEKAAGGHLVVNALDRMAGGPDDNAAQAGRGTPLTTVSGVRRLMPVECERLQGFPDGWTDITWRGKPAPDSRRYAALGDAVTVPVAEWIGVRLMNAVRLQEAA